MADYMDLVRAAVEEKPDAFKTTFDDLMKDHLKDVVASQKLQLSRSLFGAPQDSYPTEPTGDAIVPTTVGDPVVAPEGDISGDDVNDDPSPEPEEVANV